MLIVYKKIIKVRTHWNLEETTTYFIYIFFGTVSTLTVFLFLAKSINTLIFYVIIIIIENMYTEIVDFIIFKAHKGSYFLKLKLTC